MNGSNVQESYLDLPTPKFLVKKKRLSLGDFNLLNQIIASLKSVPRLSYG